MSCADQLVQLARSGEINDPHADVEDLVLNRLDKELMEGMDHEKISLFVKDMLNFKPNNADAWRKAYNKVKKTHKMCPRKSQLRYMYQKLVKKGEVEKSEDFEFCSIAKAIRSLSGVLVITVFTEAFPEFIDADGTKKKQAFSCKHNCYYCPNEPGLPRSYLSEEPGVARGKRHRWDPVDQFYARAWTHRINGHPVDKIELLVLGGTWSEYPHQYQEQFLRDIFWSANTFYDGAPKRAPLSLAEEHEINTTTRVKIIGVTLETRPDSITVEELQRMRRYGCTRLQLGIQHTNDKILKKVNRGCYRADAVRATQLAKDVGFKLDFHLMPDLPGATPELDMEMFEDVLYGEDLQADQWKIYPCEVVPWTVIQKWFERGEYVPYEDKVLFELILKVKTMVHPWIRLNRVIRDIPNQYIMGGNEITNLRQILGTEMKKRGLRCKCIRCREVGSKKRGHNQAVLMERYYRSSGGDEYFLSFESPDELTIYGFVRLRLTDRAGLDGAFPELTDAALIRELHVYGRLRAVDDTGKKKGESQHFGFGKRLMQRAEEIAKSNGFFKSAVIAGIGTREYYKNIGYELEGTYMCKKLSGPQPSVPFAVGIASSLIFATSVYRGKPRAAVAAGCTAAACSLAHQKRTTKRLSWRNLTIGTCVVGGLMFSAFR